MEEGSSSQSGITPELLQALAKQLLETTQTKTTVTIGPYKLNPFSKESGRSFKTVKPVTEQEQCIVDYLWNAKNKAQLTMSIHALAWYLHEKRTMSHKALTITPDSVTTKLEPRTVSLHYRKLEEKNKMMEEDLKIVEEKIKFYETIVENYEKLKEYVRQKEQEEQLETWKDFPHLYNPDKIALLENTFAEKMAHQIHLQKTLRKLCRVNNSLLTGITYKATTYKTNTGFKGCTFVSCSLDLRYYKPTTFEGANLTLDGLLSEGAIHQLVISEKKQLQHIYNERLSTTLRIIFEEQGNKLVCLRIHSIPPSYFVNNIDPARMLIFIDNAEQYTNKHTPINEEDLVSEDAIDLLEQIYYYRSAVFQNNVKRKEDEDYYLIAGSHTMNLYCREDYSIPFANQKTSHPEQVFYFNKIGISQNEETKGDLSRPLISAESSPLSSATFSEETENNIANKMED